MWAGVQNVSRPIVRCHEMSQITPSTTLVEAKSTAQTYQGTSGSPAGAMLSAGGSELGVVKGSAVAVGVTMISSGCPNVEKCTVVSWPEGSPRFSFRRITEFPESRANHGCCRTAEDVLVPRSHGGDGRILWLEA